MKLPIQPAPGPITPKQLQTARAVLGSSAERLADRSGTTAYSIDKYERFGRVASKRGAPRDFDALAAIRAALEAAGVEFTNGDERGVKLRKSGD